jgi:hypothetical protein
MIHANNFFGTYFKNKKDCKVVCSCCGRKISKGYIVNGMNLGENCYEHINTIFTQNVIEGTWQVGFLQLQKMHFDWIKNA